MEKQSAHQRAPGAQGARGGLVEAGFGKRIMFGSDASMWPQTISIGIEAIESADFLTEAQKCDILYNNAARFLRLGEKNQPQNRPG